MSATGVHVLLRWVSPVPSNENFTNFVLSISVGFQRMDFPLNGMGQLSFPEVDAYLRKDSHEVDEAVRMGREADGQTECEHPVRDWFLAVVPGVKLLIKREGTSTVKQHPFYGELKSSSRCCFVGEVRDGEFCLENDRDDLRVIYRREVQGASLEEARRIFDGLLEAVGFTHGCHAWPAYFSHSRHSEVVEQWVKPVHKLQKDPLLPMTKSRMFISEDARNLFTMAATFFASEGETIRYYKRSLWLMRSACEKNMPFPVRLITLCSIIEGVLKRFSPRNNGEIDPANLRVGDANSWRSLVGHAGLSWGDFENVYESHRAIRNQLAHGFDPSSEQLENGEEFNAYSRITGAIYILMAKRMGFTGHIERSQLEGNELVDLL